MKLKEALSILLVTAMILSFGGCARETYPQSDKTNPMLESETEPSMDALPDLWFSDALSVQNTSPITKQIGAEKITLNKKFPCALGVFSGKRQIGSFLLTEDFVCSDPLSRIFSSPQKPFGISQIQLQIQNSQNPNEEIASFHSQNNLGSMQSKELNINGQHALSYVIGDLDNDNTQRLLQPQDRCYRHIIEFTSGNYFICAAYSAKGIDNPLAEEFMISVLETLSIEEGHNQSSSIIAFENWSKLGPKAPFLFENQESLSQNNLTELFAYFCEQTHAPLYRIIDNKLEPFDSLSGKKSLQYSDSCAAETDDFSHFAKTYFQFEPVLSDSQTISGKNIVLLPYNSYFPNPYNGLNDVYLLDEKQNGDEIILKLYYDYGRTSLVTSVQELYCTVTAQKSGDSVIFKNCTIDKTISADEKPADSTKKSYSLSPQILEKVDTKNASDIVDAFYLGLNLEEQNYTVFQENMVFYTRYCQISDAGFRSMGLPDLTSYPGQAAIDITTQKADGSFVGVTRYLLSFDDGSITEIN